MRSSLGLRFFLSAKSTQNEVGLQGDMALLWWRKTSAFVVWRGKTGTEPSKSQVPIDWFSPPSLEMESGARVVCCSLRSPNAFHPSKSTQSGSCVHGSWRGRGRYNRLERSGTNPGSLCDCPIPESPSHNQHSISHPLVSHPNNPWRSCFAYFYMRTPTPFMLWNAKKKLVLRPKAAVAVLWFFVDVSKTRVESVDMLSKKCILKQFPSMFFWRLDCMLEIRWQLKSGIILSTSTAQMVASSSYAPSKAALFPASNKAQTRGSLLSRGLNFSGFYQKLNSLKLRGLFVVEILMVQFFIHDVDIANKNTTACLKLV